MMANIKYVTVVILYPLWSTSNAARGLFYSSISCDSFGALGERITIINPQMLAIKPATIPIMMSAPQRYQSERDSITAAKIPIKNIAQPNKIVAIPFTESLLRKLFCFRQC